MTKEALKLALEALEESKTNNDSMEFHDRKNKAITAIEKALAQTQEPVVCRPRLERVKGNDFEEWRKNISPELYAAGDAVLCWVNEGDLCMPPPQRTEQEPVFWFDPSDFAVLRASVFDTVQQSWRKGWNPLYTSPPQRKPLSAEQVDTICAKWTDKNGNSGYSGRRQIARAIEVAHGIKGDA
jgi:hypothetical protein